jgi:hypothetical protein
VITLNLILGILEFGGQKVKIRETGRDAILNW